MNDRRNELLFEPLQDAVRKVQTESEQGSWMSNITRAAVVVALVGGLLGGVSTSYDLWRHWVAKSDVVIETGDSLTISWNRRQRNLSFTRGITVHNDGEAIGVVHNPPKVRLQAPSSTSTTDLQEIQFEEKGEVVGFPLSIRAGDSRDVQITMSVTVPDADTGFLKDGVYRLYLTLDTPSTPEPKVSCIQVTKQLIDTINESGSVRYSTPDSCST